MRKFLCVALTLAMLCATAALAETLEEFCQGFNASLPEFFEGMDLDEETVKGLIQVFSLSHNENVSESTGHQTYSAEANLLSVAAFDADDPSAGVAIVAAGDTDEDKELVAWVFLLYFAEHYDLPTGGVNELLDRIMEGSGSGSAGMLGDYFVTYTNADGYVSILLMK